MKNLLFLYFTFVPLNVCLADHPIDIERYSAEGHHFEAIRTFKTVPQRVQTQESMVAAARSYWALGLVGDAHKTFDSILANYKLSDTEKARVFLSKGIIEFQEGRFQSSILFAERAIEFLPLPGPLRSQVWLLLGENLLKTKQVAAAEDKYRAGLAEASDADLPEANLLLGRCLLAQGRWSDAMERFGMLPLDNPYSDEAIKYLAEAALMGEKYDKLGYWLAKGREIYPSAFLDAWTDYALMKSAIAENNVNKVREVRETATKRFPPSDPWFVLLEAAAEIYEWQNAEQEIQKNKVVRGQG